MPDAKIKRPTPPITAGKIISRILGVLVAGLIIGTVTSRVIAFSNQQPGPAGFGRGMLHGAMMPCAMPNLLIGHDVTIYAENNTGRTYKLGYTMGVNGCGLIFFGIFFWRLSRWRRLARGGS